MIYETKGLTLEEVDELYNEVSTARASVGWRPRTPSIQAREKSETQGGGVEHAEVELRVDGSA